MFVLVITSLTLASIVAAQANLTTTASLMLIEPSGLIPSFTVIGADKTKATFVATCPPDAVSTIASTDTKIPTDFCVPETYIQGPSTWELKGNMGQITIDQTCKFGSGGMYNGGDATCTGTVDSPEIKTSVATTYNKDEVKSMLSVATVTLKEGVTLPTTGGSITAAIPRITIVGVAAVLMAITML